MHMRVAPHAGAWIETKRRSNKNRLFVVAPHAGAWIETTPNIALLMDDMASRPTRARGLKPVGFFLTVMVNAVAPHAGAWIETQRRRHDAVHLPVAPHAGAWIETDDNARRGPIF